MRPTTGPFWSICWPTACCPTILPSATAPAGWRAWPRTSGHRPGLLAGGGRHRPRRGQRHADRVHGQGRELRLLLRGPGQPGPLRLRPGDGPGSCLTCSEQRATLEDRGQIEIVRQNFGFDLEQGVKTVALDPAEPHYYLEVRRQSGTIPQSPPEAEP